MKDIHSLIEKKEEALFKKIESTEASIRKTIDAAVTASSQRHGHTEVLVNGYRDDIMQHKLEKISRTEAKDMIDNRVEPIWDYLKDLKQSLIQLSHDQKELLQGISRIEGSLTERRKREE